MRNWVLLIGVAASVAAHAQDACESKCNQASAECLRVCVAKPSGDSKGPKDPKDPKEQSAKMMQCLNTCEAEAKPCREKCHPPKK